LNIVGTIKTCRNANYGYKDSVESEL